MKRIYYTANNSTINNNTDQDLPFINTTTSMDILKETKRIVNKVSLYKTFTLESRERAKNKIALNRPYSRQTLNPANESTITEPNSNNKNSTKIFYAEISKRTKTEYSTVDTTSSSHKVTNNQECCAANLREYLNYDFEEMYIAKGINLLEQAYIKMRHSADFARNTIIKTFKNKEKRVDLKIKSVSLDLIMDNKVLSSIYLPFEFIIIFSICNLETILLILSQILKLEENGLKINNQISDVIKRLETVAHFEVKNRYTFNKDLKFNWITEKGIMTAVLRRPKINLKIKNKNLTLTKILDVKLFYYLYHKNFINCEDYIFTDLVSTKLFRQYFHSSLSKLNTILGLGVVNLDGDRIAPENIYLDTNHYICVIFTTRGINFFLKFNSYILQSRRFAKHTLNINWKRSFSLIELSQILNLENYINRRAKYNDKTDEFVFDARWLDNVNRHDISFYKENLLLKNKKNFIVVLNPFIEYQSLANNRVSKSKIKISETLIKKMLNYNSIDDLSIFVSKNMNELIDSDESNFV